MRLLPRELDKLVLHQAGAVAQKRYARGLLLNYTESVSLIASLILEWIRDGERVGVLMGKGKKILGFSDVMSGVADMVAEVQVEGTFPDGTKLVTVHHPICSEKGDPKLALYGSGLKSARGKRDTKNSVGEHPGEELLSKGEIELNAGRKAIELDVVNMGDRPVQVGSHYPFFETNADLEFDRQQAFGKRLDIPSGTAVRFEPGEKKRVSLIDFAGQKVIYGGNALIMGKADAKRQPGILKKSRKAGFRHRNQDRA